MSKVKEQVVYIVRSSDDDEYYTADELAQLPQSVMYLFKGNYYPTRELGMRAYRNEAKACLLQLACSFYTNNITSLTAFNFRTKEAYKHIPVIVDNWDSLKAAIFSIDRKRYLPLGVATSTESVDLVEKYTDNAALTHVMGIIKLDAQMSTAYACRMFIVNLSAARFLIRYVEDYLKDTGKSIEDLLT